MSKGMQIFILVAVLFAIATLIYVAGSIIRELRSRKKAKTHRASADAAYLPMGRSSGAWLLAGLLGVTSGILVSSAMHRRKESQKSSGKKKRIVFWKSV